MITRKAIKNALEQLNFKNKRMFGVKERRTKKNDKKINSYRLELN